MIFIRIVLIYLIIGVLLALYTESIYHPVLDDKAKFINRKPKNDARNAILVVICVLWLPCLIYGLYDKFKFKKTLNDSMMDTILDDEFYEDSE